jgi:diguanylate cyclase (GGDEF)-like protein
MHQILGQTWLINILVISVIIQVAVAIIASGQIKDIKDGYRIAWILMCIGLFLMVERRVAPLWRLLEYGEVSNIIDAYFGLVISILLLIGNFGIRELFKNIELQHAKLIELANKDELTGLDNRRCILEKVKSEMNRSLRIKCNFSLLMIDIDHFKHVNDTFGHAAGDSVLRQISEITAKALRNIDAVGRIGGEEFLVVLPDTNSKDALTTAERLRMAIANYDFHLDNQPTSITISIGVVSQVLERKADVDILLETLDEALYRAKNNGRNRVEI